MPRRSTRKTTQVASAAEPSSGGGRKTRGAIKADAGKEEPTEKEAEQETTTSRGRSRKGQGDSAASKQASPSPSPSPTPTGRSRKSRGTKAEEPASKPTRASSRAKKAKPEPEPESEEEELLEEEEEEEELPPPKKTRKSPAKKGKGKGKGRGAKKSPAKKAKSPRKKKTKDEEDEEDDEEDWEEEMAKDLAAEEEETPQEEAEAEPEEELATEESPRSSRSRRSSRGSPKKTPVQSPSSRKSPRGASKKASEAIEAIAKSEDVEDTPERETTTEEEVEEALKEEMPTEEAPKEDLPSAAAEAEVQEAVPEITETKEETGEDAQTSQISTEDAKEEKMDEEDPEKKENQEPESMQVDVPDTEEQLESNVEEVMQEESKNDKIESEPFIEAPVEAQDEKLDPEQETKKRKRDLDESDETDNKKAKTEETPVDEPPIVPEEASFCGTDDTAEAPTGGKDAEEDMEAENEQNIEEAKVADAQCEDVGAEDISPEPVVEQAPVSEMAELIPAEKVQEQESCSALPSQQESGTDLRDYVVIDMKDVPDSHSSEVAESLPKEHDDSNSNNIEASTAVEDKVQPEHCATVEPVPEPQVDAPSQIQSNQNGDEPQQLSNACETSCVNSNDTASKTDIDPLVSRRLVINPTFSGNFMNGAPFTIATYNILAECHVKRANYHWVPSEYMDLTYRHKRLLQEVKFLNADIVCMQEVDPDYYDSQLKPSLELLGYNSVYKKRLDEFHHEGEATFYKKSRFSLIQTESYSLKDLANKELSQAGLTEDVKSGVVSFLDSAAVLLITKFQCIHSQKVVTVGNVHVDYAKFANPSLQCVQVASAVQELVSFAGGPNCPHMIVGDFNCWPGTPAYQLTKEGYLNDQSMSDLQAQECITLPDGQKQSLVNLWWKGFQHTSSTLTSAYQTVFNKEPITCHWLEGVEGSEPVTSHVADRDAGIGKPLDYIWFSSDAMDVANVLQTCSVEDLLKPSGGIPSVHFPSDHLSLKAQVAFK